MRITVLVRQESDGLDNKNRDIKRLSISFGFALNKNDKHALNYNKEWKL
jgi:hypothetical protein